MIGVFATANETEQFGAVLVDPCDPPLLPNFTTAEDARSLVGVAREDLDETIGSVALLCRDVPAALPLLVAGGRVMLLGLNTRGLNGKDGLLGFFDEASGRWLATLADGRRVRCNVNYPSVIC